MTAPWLKWQVSHNHFFPFDSVALPNNAQVFFVFFPSPNHYLSDSNCFPLSVQEQIHVPVYHPTPSQTRLATQLTEEEQVRIAQRIGLIQHLPKGMYNPGRDGSEKKIREWVIVVGGYIIIQGLVKTLWKWLCCKLENWGWHWIGCLLLHLDSWGQIYLSIFKWVILHKKTTPFCKYASFEIAPDPLRVCAHIHT